jgi:DNA-binding FadR family transcriptional regulator
MSLPTILPQAPRHSLVDTTIDLMRGQIESAAWKVGQRIPNEAALAAMLQVGRNTVREAVRVLSHAKVLEVRQGDGTYVLASIDAAEVMRRVDRASLRDHFELRSILETEAARLAATRRDAADLLDLTRLLKARNASRHNGDVAAFIALDIAFHAAIAKAAHNVALEELFRYFAASAQSPTEAVLVEAGLPEPDEEAHAKVLAAIAARQPAQAAKAAKDIIAPLLARLTEPRQAAIKDRHVPPGYAPPQFSKSRKRASPRG